VIAIFFIPLFYYLVERMFAKKDEPQTSAQTPSAQLPDGAAQNRHEGD
jgi:multidrug efflux pump